MRAGGGRGRDGRDEEMDTIGGHSSPVFLCCSLTGPFVAAGEARADWSDGSECHCISSGLEFVCVGVRLCAMS